MHILIILMIMRISIKDLEEQVFADHESDDDHDADLDDDHDD